MAITGDTTLRLALRDYLNRSDTTAYEDNVIQAAERWIYRNVRCRIMETALAGTVSAGAVPVPGNYIGLKHAYINGSTVQNLQVKNPDFIYQNYPVRSSGGKPKFVAREGSNFIFGPYPDSNYSMQGVYYQKFPSILSTSTNGLISDHPDLWLFACLCEFEPFLENDERVMLWKSKRDEAALNINGEDSRWQNWAGGALAMTSA